MEEDSQQGNNRRSRLGRIFDRFRPHQPPQNILDGQNSVGQQEKKASEQMIWRDFSEALRVVEEKIDGAVGLSPGETRATAQKYLPVLGDCAKDDSSQALQIWLSVPDTVKRAWKSNIKTEKLVPGGPAVVFRLDPIFEYFSMHTDEKPEVRLPDNSINLNYQKTTLSDGTEAVYMGDLDLFSGTNRIRYHCHWDRAANIGRFRLEVNQPYRDKNSDKFVVNHDDPEKPTKPELVREIWDNNDKDNSVTIFRNFSNANSPAIRGEYSTVDGEDVSLSSGKLTMNFGAGVHRGENSLAYEFMGGKIIWSNEVQKLASDGAPVPLVELDNIKGQVRFISTEDFNKGEVVAEIPVSVGKGFFEDYLSKLNIKTSQEIGAKIESLKKK